jgi:hypothetical protein
MINDRVMMQGAARRPGVEDDAIRKHTQGDSSQDGVGTPTPVEEVARGVES